MRIEPGQAPASATAQTPSQKMAERNSAVFMRREGGQESARKADGMNPYSAGRAEEVRVMF